jgi:hypothetical protein
MFVNDLVSYQIKRSFNQRGMREREILRQRDKDRQRGKETERRPDF